MHFVQITSKLPSLDGRKGRLVSELGNICYVRLTSGEEVRVRRDQLRQIKKGKP